MSESSPGSQKEAPPPEARPAGPLTARLEPALRLAGSLVGATRRLALYSALAAAWLAGLLVVVPFEGLATGPRIALGGAATGLLLTPPFLVFLFWLGLRELLDVPRRLIAHAGAGKDQALDVMRTAVDRGSYTSSRGLGRVVGAVTRLRTILVESRGLLVHFSAVARLISPVFMPALLFSVAACWVLILAAVVSLLIVVL